jgi:hypothetical protein
MRLSGLVLCLITIAFGGCAARHPTQFLYALLHATSGDSVVPGSGDTAIVSADYYGVGVTGRVLQPEMGGEIRPQVVQEGRVIVLQITSGPGSMDMVGHPSYHVDLALPPGHYTLEVQHAWIGLFLEPHISYLRRYSITVPARRSEAP